MRRCILWAALAIVASWLSGMSSLAAEDPAAIKFTAGTEADLQALLDKAPEKGVVVCEQTEPLVVSQTLIIRKPITLCGLKAKLPEKLGSTPVLIMEAEGVTLTDLDMRGNYDSVSQQHRAPMIHVKRGGFSIEHCKFSDTTKDGIMVTPDHGAGDIVGGIIRDIEGVRIGRDLVSLSGGNAGERIRDVTVENVSLKKGYLRGAVEVNPFCDGTDNVTVRHIYAEEAVYAIDVQDHGAEQKKTRLRTAPNTNVILEDVTAVGCKHVIRTANHPDIGHANLTLRGFTARNCSQPFLLSNTTHVRAENLTIINEPAAKNSCINLRNVHDVVIRNVNVQGFQEGVNVVDARKSSEVAIEGVKVNGKETGK